MTNQCVYFHINSINNELFYVGMGNSKRPYDFRGRNKYWKQVVSIYGNPIVLIVADNLSVEQAADIEKFWIKLHGLERLTNLSPGGDGIFGTYHTAEHRAKISKAQIGKKLSEEHKRKIGLRHKGKKLSEDAKQKLSDLYKGRIFTAETLNKIGFANSDKTLFKFYHDQHGLKICTKRELNKSFNIHPGHILSVTKGRRKQHKGWRIIE